MAWPTTTTLMTGNVGIYLFEMVRLWMGILRSWSFSESNTSRSYSIVHSVGGKDAYFLSSSESGAHYMQASVGISSSRRVTIWIFPLSFEHSHRAFLLQWYQQHTFLTFSGKAFPIPNTVPLCKPSPISLYFLRVSCGIPTYDYEVVMVLCLDGLVCLI